MSHQQKWVIVFLIYADFRIDPKDPDQHLLGTTLFSMNREMKIELDLMCKEILTTPLNPDNARLYVIFNGIKYVNNEHPNLCIEDNTLFYEIINPNNKVNNQLGPDCDVISKGIYDEGMASPHLLQIPEKLSAIFGRIKVKEDEEVFLVTWDHGSGFGIFRDVNLTHQPVEERKPIFDELDKYPYLREFWFKALEKKNFNDIVAKEKLKKKTTIIQSGHNLYKFKNEDEKTDKFRKILSERSNSFLEIQKINGQPQLFFDKEEVIRLGILEENSFFSQEDSVLLLDDKVTEILNNDELAVALKSWLTDKKVGVLLMMNCWMMNLHTMYSFRETVHCLVAPQGTIAIPGYNYRDILRYIYQPKSIFRTSQKLAKKCVQTCENKFAQKRADNLYKKLSRCPEKIDTWKIIALDLQIADVDGKNLYFKQIEALRCLIDEFNSQPPGNKASEVRFLYKYVRSVCFDFTRNESMMIDILNWCLSIKYADGNINEGKGILLKVKDKITDFRNLIMREDGLPSLLLKTSKGQSIYSFENPALPIAVVNLEPTGYGLFFPLNDFSDLNLKKNIQADSFLNTYLINWKVFLNKNIDHNINL